VLIGFNDADVAGLAAIRAIVKAVLAQPDVVLRLAETAVFFAFALHFRLVTLRADNVHFSDVSRPP